jgi:uncharacterized repeat protein (TIGR03803 family)
MSDCFPSPSFYGVVRDAAGNLYGTTFLGGSANQGLVYKLDTANNYTILYSFTGGADGGSPASLLLGPAGNLYGTAGGGAYNHGVVFKLDPSTARKRCCIALRARMAPARSATL